MKILIVDDSLMDRKLLINSLKKAEMNNEILQAADGEEGFRILSSHYKEICLIILDWQMPGMSGLEFMEAVVKVPHVASIPIIMVTASSSEENRKMAKAVNPNLAGYLVKPYIPDQLIETIGPFVKA